MRFPMAFYRLANLSCIVTYTLLTIIYFTEWADTLEAKIVRTKKSHSPSALFPHQLQDKTKGKIRIFNVIQLQKIN